MRRHQPIHCGARFGALFAIGVLAILLAAAPAALASKAVTGTFGAPGGEGNGQLHNPKGIAVNRTGAGGVNAGDVYVADSANNRIEEFSATGAFVRAFGYDVVASGPDNTGASEKQEVSVDATGGTYALALTRKTFVDITEGSNVIAHVYAPTSAFHVGDAVKGSFPAGTTITAVGTETLVLSAAATATSTETEFSATEATAQMLYNNTAAELQAALEALQAIGSGNVTVTGSSGALVVEYVGALAHDDFAHTANGAAENGNAMTAVSTALSGGATHTAKIVTTVPGGGYEVCEASVSNDVCKGGPHCNRGETSVEACQEGSAAGSLDDPDGVTIDQGTGDVYVADVTGNSGESNNRVNAYSATGAFQGSFGWNVNMSDPKEELQFCTDATGCQRGTTGNGAGQLGQLTESRPALGPDGRLYVPDGSQNGSGNNRVDEFAPTVNGSGEVTDASFVGAVGWDVVASGPDQADEIQKVTVKASAGEFKLAYKGETTKELAFDAPAEEAEEVPGGPESVEKALNSLPSISAGGGSVTVTDGPGSANGSAPYTVTFSGGPLARTDVAQMTATKVGLSGGSPTSSVSVETFSNGTEGLEDCVVARGDVCKAGSEGEKLGQFASHTPSGVAVDESGALYAVSDSRNLFAAPARIYKFTFPAPGEVAAEEFAPEYLTQTSGDPTAVDATDVAVDPVSQHVLVAKREGTGAAEFFEFDSSGRLLDTSPAGEAGLKANRDMGLAIGTGGRFYFSNGSGAVDILGPPPAPTVSIAAVTEIGATSATFHGTVTPLPVGPEGESFDTTYHFEYSSDGVNWSRVPDEEVDVGDGSGSGSPDSCPVNNPPSCTVEQTVTGLVPNSHYQVRLVATTGTVAISAGESFTTEAASPLVSGTDVEEVGETSAELTGFVNPANEGTTYHFEWGTGTNYGNQAPVGAEGSAGSGGQLVKVSAVIEGLHAGTTYHFRLLATNPSGTRTGPDIEFSTMDSYGLPDARAPEQVTPSDKRPVGMVAQLLEDGQLTFQASRDGNSILYPLLNGLADATAGGNVEYLGERGESGWRPVQVTPPSLVPAISAQRNGGTGKVLYASADLSCQLIESFEPLTEDTPLEDVTNGVNNLYRRSSDGFYTLLSMPAPLNHGSGGFTVDWASADCSHVLFESDYRLLQEAPAGVPVLYEWVEGALSVAGVRPDESAPGGESVADDATAGMKVGAFATSWNSMSSSGSKVFFTATSKAGADKGKRAIFVREGGATTVDVSQSDTATVDTGAYYATASADGSHVFFIANYGLARNGSSTGVSGCSNVSSELSGLGCDLYDYNTVAKTLTDVSADANPTDAMGAGVICLLDASDDGSYVYFAARGQLVPNKGRSEAQNLLGDGSYNVYVSHEGSLAYVGSISTADTESSQGATDVSVDMSHWVADATPDGTHLLFVSKANVTGYESKGVSEAYLYSAGSGETVCVSCRPDGLPSEGTSHAEPIVPEVQGKSLRPRSVSDDGRRVFFTMPDVLATGARARSHNIYEWEAGRVYLLVAGEEADPDLTRYADASANGDDVFVVTKKKLVTQDFDNTTDVYDLRAGGGFAEPAPATPPCNPLADRCQGEAKPPLLEAPGPVSEAFFGPGNQLPVVASCKKGLVLEHGKCVGKKPAPKSKKTKSKPCKKRFVRKHGKCMRKSPAAHHKRAATNDGRASQ